MAIGDLATVQYLLEQVQTCRLDISAQAQRCGDNFFVNSPRLRTVLGVIVSHRFLSFFYGFLSLFFIFVRKSLGADDALRRTPLHYACHQGSIEVVEALLEAGADTMSRDAQDAIGSMLFNAFHIYIL